MFENISYETIIKKPITIVTWLDATDRTINLKNKTDINLLTERKTIGILIHKDSEKIMLCRDITEDGDVEITTIPKDWVVKTIKVNK